MTIEPNDIAASQEWVESRLKGMRFGRMLKIHRLSEDWTQEEAAQKLGISKQLLSAYETGKKHPSVSKAYEMANILGIHPAMAVLALVNEQLRLNNLPFQLGIAS